MKIRGTRGKGEQPEDRPVKEKTLFRRANKPDCSHQSNFPLIDGDIITRSLQVRHTAATKGARVTNGANRADDSPVVPASTASHYPPGNKSNIGSTELGSAKKGTVPEVRPIVHTTREISRKPANARKCCPQSNLAGLNPFNNFLAHKSFRLRVVCSRPSYSITVIAINIY